MLSDFLLVIFAFIMAVSHLFVMVFELLMGVLVIAALAIIFPVSYISGVVKRMFA